MDPSGLSNEHFLLPVFEPEAPASLVEDICLPVQGRCSTRLSYGPILYRIFGRVYRIYGPYFCVFKYFIVNMKNKKK